RTHDAAEAEVAGGRIDRLRHPRRRPIAPAIIRRAQIRTTLHHLARDANPGCVRVVALLCFASARVVDRAAGSLYLAVILVPVGGPFPDVAGHLVEAVAVGRERADWRCPLVAVLAQVLPRKLALPGVRHRLAVRHQLVTPAELGALEAAARGEFP